MKNYFNPDPSEWTYILQRPLKDERDLDQVVSEVFEAIQRGGDTEVKRFVERYDSVALEELYVSQEEFLSAEKAISDDLKDAIRNAYKTIHSFHLSQKQVVQKVQTSNGIVCWQEKRPIEKVGLYIPGGTAPLFSTILMLAIPAKIAGCGEIVMCTPCDKDGVVNPAVLFTASLCGIEKVFKIGGIQAIAAMTHGTESVPSVYKLFGPGNQYVTAAKQYAQKFGLAIDLPAGPSELLVYADETAKADFIAADLLSQAEHGEDSQVVFVSDSRDLIEETRGEIQAQLKALPRKEIANKSLEHARLILIEDQSLALDMINEYGPEHLIISIRNYSEIISKIINAGSVFLGNYSPESAGDYASGTNHTLPTNGYAKNYSGVNLDSFQKAITFQELTPEGIEGIGPTIELMAEAEGLFAHKNAVSVRLAELKRKES